MFLGKDSLKDFNEKDYDEYLNDNFNKLNNIILYGTIIISTSIILKYILI